MKSESSSKDSSAWTYVDLADVDENFMEKAHVSGPKNRIRKANKQEDTKFMLIFPQCNKSSLCPFSTAVVFYL